MLRRTKAQRDGIGSQAKYGADASPSPERLPRRSVLGGLLGAGCLAGLMRTVHAQPPAPPLLDEFPEPKVAERSTDGKLRILVLGAHPDDAEIRAGGTAALWAEAGHHVQLCSVTNGDIGHQRMHGPKLAARRKAEVEAADKLLGASTRVLDIHDGELEPTLENRRAILRAIRQWRADIVIGHRPNDYHPDHRYVGVLMQDAAYMVTVPHFCPDTPYLPDNPMFLYSYDGFQRPNPFRGDVVVPIDAAIDRKVRALVTMESQFVEGGVGGSMPKDEADRARKAADVAEFFRRRFAAVADRYRQQLVAQYGEQGRAVKYAEAFEVCEYGRQLGGDPPAKWFPVPQRKA